MTDMRGVLKQVVHEFVTMDPEQRVRELEALKDSDIARVWRELNPESERDDMKG